MSLDARSGLVSKKSAFQRKHRSDHVSQKTGVIQTEEGILSIDERQEFPRRRRDADTNVVATGGIIGGIDISTEQRYQTNYRSLAEQEGTSRSQLILSKRQLPRRRLDNPVQQQQLQQQHVFSKMSQFLVNNALSDSAPAAADGSLAGYRAPRAVSKSLLSSVGANILDSAPKSAPSSSSYSTASPRLAADSYQNNKILITEIYNNTPGEYIACC
jgi:hypothetical protein